MNRRSASIAAVAALVGALALGARADDTKAAAPDAYSIPLHKRHFELTYSVEVGEIPAGTKRLDVWIPVAREDDHQIIDEDQGSRNFDPGSGNAYRHIAFEGPFPDPQSVQPLPVTMTYHVTRREYIRKDFRGRGNQPLSEVEKKDVAEFLKPDRLVPIDGKIGDIAKQIAGDEKNAVNLARRFYNHVLATMKYDKPAGQPWGRGDALWACDAKYGNCSDFHSVFIGLCRAMGIPARFSIGFPIPEKRGEGEIGGYHCWAEFYIAGYGWVPVDISEARKHPEMAEYYFGALTEDRVQLSTGRDLTLVPPQKGEPVNFIVYPYAELDGKPWDGVKRKFTYKDLE